MWCFTRSHIVEAYQRSHARELQIVKRSKYHSAGMLCRYQTVGFLSVGVEPNFYVLIVPKFFSCVTEFVQLVYTEAVDLGTKENKNTVTPEHVMKAVENLELGQYTAGLKAYFDEWKEAVKGKT